MKCKDCYHYKLCFDFGFILDPLHGGVICDDFINNTDVKEIKYGQWIKNDYSQTVCSQCKAPIPGYWGQYDGCPDGIWTEIQETDYCPNCGTKMDGDV